MKGITPIISIIILLGITLAMAGLAYSYLMGELMPRISGSFTIPTNGAFCTNSVITVQVTNTGTGDLTSPGDFTLFRVDGTDVTSSLVSVTIAPGGSAVVLDYNCGGSCSSGAHIIDITTESAAEHPPVYCT